jgi:phosphoglycolate phosphatase
VIQALVFDLDGTLVESLPGIGASLNRALEQLGQPTHPLARVRRFVGRGVAMLARQALPGEPTDEMVTRLADAFRADYGRTWASTTHLLPGVQATLAALESAGIPLAIWSNKPHEFTVEMVGQLFPATRFEVVLGLRDGVPRKPDPAAAREIDAVLGHPGGATALVGDSLTDVESARLAGWLAVAVASGYEDPGRLRAAAPDHWLDDITALPSLCR